MQPECSTDGNRETPPSGPLKEVWVPGLGLVEAIMGKDCRDFFALLQLKCVVL